MRKTTPEVSIIIPAYKEVNYIGRLLESLAKQRYKGLEVIVSDGTSKDGTKEVVQGFKRGLDVRFVESPPKGPGWQRNFGAKHAKGGWLLFLDADGHTDDIDFVETIVKGAEKRGWQTATPRLKIKDGTFLERLGISLNYRYMKLLSRTKHPVALGWCILTKKDLFNKYGGFNEMIRLGEDYDYVSRVGHAGFGFVDGTYFYYDMRRSHAEGLSLSLKAVANEIYRHTHGYNLENSPFKYEFGKHDQKK